MSDQKDDAPVTKFAGKQIDPNDLALQELGVVRKLSDMDTSLQREVGEIAHAAVRKYSVENDVADFIKAALEDKYPRTWQVIVGTNFGSMVTHESKFFMYFYIGQLAFLVWKSN